MTATISEQYKCLVDILSCLVCKQMVTKAHICPNCSKFYCLDCIIRQLAVEQTCLNCNKFLQVSMLVNCQKLCSQLSETLEKVSSKRPESIKSPHQKLSLYCGKHKLQKTYYCKTCEKPLCSDCSVLTENHRGHEFIKLALMRNAYEARIHEKVDEINSAQKNIQKRLELADVIKMKKGVNNQQNLIKFQNSMKLLKQELRKNLKKVMSQGQKNLEEITDKLEKWNQIFDGLMKRLKNCSKGKFVEREYDILQKELIQVLQKIDSQNQNSISQLNLTTMTKQMQTSYVHPVYEQFVFAVNGVSDRIGDQGYFYSSSVKTKMGLQWRLKIYPEGIVDSMDKDNCHQRNVLIKKHSKNQEEYFAIFIQFVSGCVSTTKQKYALSLINQADYSKSFTRQFESEFDIGECWGYEHFMKLNQMYEEDYYNQDDDMLEIVLKICPSNYFQATKDQEAFIKQKRYILSQQEILLNKLESEEISHKKLASTSSIISIGQSS